MKSQSSVLNEDAMAEDIIKLQLRKPKHWQWELTTSKSSPNISFPVIQLLNRKGSLMAEVKDNGSLKQCFKSAEPTSDINNNKGRQLRKSKSDMKHNFGKAAVVEDKVVNKCSATVEKGEEGKLIKKQKSDATDSPHRLQKSKSDTLGRRVSFQNNFRKNFMPIAEESKRIEETPPSYVHKRTASDEMYDYFIKKHKDASIKRAISDGYSNFLTPASYTSSSNEFPMYRYSFKTSNAGMYETLNRAQGSS